MIDYAPTDSPTSKDTVKHVRVNYKSGAYIQSWFKTFEVDINRDGEVSVIEYELAEVHPDAQGQIAYPVEIGTKHIESVWVMSVMSADELYNKSMTV